VTAGASAPESLVQAVIEQLAPTGGVEVVQVITEDEYFPPPPELRELLPALSACLSLLAGGPAPAGRADPMADDRTRSAAAELAGLAV
jgi:4-hydroxy-3-methylbut-2-enyl diphosphate reductase